MRALIMALVAGILLPSAALGPVTPMGPSYAYPASDAPIFAGQAYVEMTAIKYGVPVALAMAIWQKESSQAVRVPDGDDGERGPFQVMEIAAREEGCEWERLQEFRAGVDCGMRYLKSSLQLCGTLIRAAHRYNNGRCPRRGKIWAYAMDVQKLMMEGGRGF